MQRIALHISLLLVFIVSSTCKRAEKKQNKQQILEIDVDTSSVYMKYKSTVFSIPSPQHASFMIKNHKIPYNDDILNPVENYPKYTTSEKKALNLGIYGTDLGYLNIYDKPRIGIEYLMIIERLSEELEITKVIDAKTISEIENNMGNTDYILNVIAKTYKNFDKYLSDNNREVIGLLILTGGWIESLYILSKTWQETRETDIKKHIARQKYPLEKLIKLLAPYYESSEGTTKIIDQLTDLAYEFDCIDVKYHFRAPETNPKKKITYINSESDFILNDYEFETIAKKVSKVRMHFIR
jgi:hypothetical protein